MSYSMRCKDGQVNQSGGNNVACGEWDYSCHTYIHDSTRIDSILIEQLVIQSLILMDQITLTSIILFTITYKQLTL